MTYAFDKDYWDQIWTGDRAPSMSTSEPNPHLIEEISGLKPGTAIDAGCGAGAEAIWLATQGWGVTGVDVSPTALTFAENRAPTGTLGQVEWVRADLSTWDPGIRYDLVTTHYAHPDMPQLDFYDRIASWVALQGTLFIVGHLHRHGHSQPPAEASATAAAITARLDPDMWEVVTAAESHRSLIGPGGRSTTAQDVVVRAIRHH